MITHFFPTKFHQYISLPVLGPIMDSYSGWLTDQQYTLRTTKYQIRMTYHIAKYLKHKGFNLIENVNENDLDNCYLAFRKNFPREAGTVMVLKRYLVEQNLLQPPLPLELNPKESLIIKFTDYLRDTRGFVPNTLKRQSQIVGEFLEWIKFEGEYSQLARLNINDIEAFIQHLSKRMGRVALQKPIGIMRNFLRFLNFNEWIPSGLDKQMDTPRIYRQEKLPQSLPWETIKSFLNSIDRRTAIGIRDYAMFSLMVTYGLRACDVVALKLDDIKWKKKCIQFYQTKTGKYLELPLTDEVGSAIYNYLKNVRNNGKYREIFLRQKAPCGILKPTAVTEAFQSWSLKSGLGIPFKGTRCLRHSYALHFIRSGLSVKTIGDLLGHHSPESTDVYIRLSTEDLRTVPLNIPKAIKKKEVQV